MRLFVIARRHIETSAMRKRTLLFELLPTTMANGDAGLDGPTNIWLGTIDFSLVH